MSRYATEIRKYVLRMVYQAKSSHVGAALSIVDILAVLYGSVLQIRPDEPKWIDRDRFVLSKGHGGAAVYAALALKGFFPVSELDRYCQNGSFLSGHVSHHGVPGVEVSTGSLGQGLPIAVGMAYAAQREQRKHRVFVILGDGECAEGANWEAMLFAAHHQLQNLTVIIDRNDLQSFATVSQTLNLEPFGQKWKSFGWDVTEVDGHNEKLLLNALQQKRTAPHCLIAKTIKGKGISFMENKVLWHYRNPSKEEYLAALQELGFQTEEIYAGSSS